LSYVRQVRVDPEDGSIIWPNDADADPELLYARAREQAAQSRASRTASRPAFTLESPVGSIYYKPTAKA
jgi:hypothetical protein